MAMAQFRAGRGSAQAAAGRDLTRVVLVGHSYIRRLNDFMRSTGQNANELARLCSSHTVILGQLMHFPSNAHLDDAVDFINGRLSED